MKSLSMSRSVVAVFITPVFLTHWGAAGIKSQHVKRKVKGRTDQAILLFIKEQKRRAQQSRDITEAPYGTKNQFEGNFKNKVQIEIPHLFLFVCLFDLILYVPSTIFSYKGTSLPGLNQY